MENKLPCFANNVQSNDIMNYNLNACVIPMNHCDEAPITTNCGVIPAPSNINVVNGLNGNVDIESELFTLGRYLNNDCITLPKLTESPCYRDDVGSEKFLESIDTREKKACNLPGVSTYSHQIDPLLCDPQDLKNIMQPWVRGGEDSRLTTFAENCVKYPQADLGFCTDSDKMYLTEKTRRNI